MAKKKNDAELVYTQQERNQQVIRSVHLIQNARYSLTLQEQRFLLYCISKVKPTDTVESVYSIELKDYLEMREKRRTQEINYLYEKYESLSTTMELYKTLGGRAG